MFRILVAVALAISAQTLYAQPATSPASSAAIVAFSANTTGTLGNLCSSQAGINSALQALSANQPPAGLNVTIPANLTSPLQQIAQIAWAYIVSYPLPLLAKTLAAGAANATAVNTFYVIRSTLSTYRDIGVVTPNHDTLYAQTFLDLSQGPQVITVPQFDSPKRYWIVPFLDTSLNYYAGIGSHFNSTPGQYLVVGRDAPANATYGNFTRDKIIFSPTDINWVIARILVLTDDDLAQAYSITKLLSVTPYNSAVNGSQNTSSKAAIISRSVNGSGYGVYQNPTGFLKGYPQQAAQWFNISAAVLKADPPGNSSALDLISTFTSLSQDAAAGTSNAAYQLANQVAQQCVQNSNVGLVTNSGWTFHNTSANYTTPTGTDYLLRAQDTLNIFGTLPATEVVYFFNSKDSQNRTLDASTGANYTLNFSLPVPADGFWSLTIYNGTSLLLFQNPIDRYTIGDRTAGLVYSGANNSTLQVFISATQPANGTSQFANWLPAPADAPFELILRTYVPPSTSLIGQYQPPPIVRATDPTAVASTG